jgi:hypothetical protein
MAFFPFRGPSLGPQDAAIQDARFEALAVQLARAVRPFHVSVGMPAESVRVKPTAPPDISEATTVERLPH